MLVAVLAAAVANAQPARVFVASTGSDAGPCSRALPCRNFAAAFSAVQSGGEIIVLDSAGYGAMSITKSVSVIAPGGVYAGIAASGGAAVSINAPSAKVVLRGLSIRGAGATTGIDVTAVGTLHIEKCIISDFQHHGVNFATGGKLFVDDTVSRGNGWNGVHVQVPAPSVVTGAVNRSVFEHNSSGFMLTAWDAPPGSKMTISDTICTRNSQDGIWLQHAELHVRNCKLTSNYTGIATDASAILSVSRSMITGNYGPGIYCNVSTCSSLGDNELTGNGSAMTGVTTVSPQ